jgi:hypothetical protein
MFLLENVDTLLISMPIFLSSFGHLLCSYYPCSGMCPKNSQQPIKISKKYRKNPVNTEKPILKYDNGQKFTTVCKP